MTERAEGKQWIDVARASGIFAIAYGHLVQGESVCSSFFGSFRVAIFFLIMGLTFRYKKGFVCFVKKKAKRLLIPYGVFALISVLIMALMEWIYPALVEDKTSGIVRNLCGGVYGNALTGNMKWNQPLWFLPCGFVTIVLVYCFEGRIHGLGEPGKRMARIGFILVSLAGNLLYCGTLRWLHLPFGAEVAISMSGFVEMGILLAPLGRVGNRAVSGLLGALFVVLGFILGMYNGEVSVMSLRFGDDILLYYVVALLCIVGILLLSIWLCSVKAFERARRAIAYCGRHTIAILCMHKFPILVFQYILPWTKALFVATSDGVVKNAVGFVITVIVIGMCLVVELPINRIMPVVFGNEPAKKR